MTVASIGRRCLVAGPSPAEVDCPRVACLMLRSDAPGSLGRKRRQDRGRTDISTHPMAAMVIVPTRSAVPRRRPPSTREARLRDRQRQRVS